MVGLGLLTLVLPRLAAQTPISKIAFGSCGHQDHPLPIFDRVVEHEPDLFIFLGDNIYGDTDDMEVLKAKYQMLGSKPTFQRLKAEVPILATWDDHDFGRNDAGRHYPYKAEAKEVFLDFFGEPMATTCKDHEGIYQSYYYPVNGNMLQVILLDNRTFRDKLQPYNGEVADQGRYFYDLDYAPYTSSDSTLLGETQWAWLKGELSKPADLRIIGSSTQFGIEFNGYEAWANFPHERQRFLDLIKETQANGVIFISGDVHYAEISKLEQEDLYPIYDVTASGLSSTWYFATPNQNRIEGPIMDNHFGLISIDWEQADPEVLMEIWDIHDNQRVEYRVHLSEIGFSEE